MRAISHRLSKGLPSVSDGLSFQNIRFIIRNVSISFVVFLLTIFLRYHTSVLVCLCGIVNKIYSILAFITPLQDWLTAFSLLWIPWNLSFHYIDCTGQFTPKMKANVESRLLSSLVWIDSGVVVSHEIKCNSVTCFMEFMSGLLTV